MFGDLFPTLHVAAVIMHGLIVVIVFYTIPRKFLLPEYKGYFLSREQFEIEINTSASSALSSTPYSENGDNNDTKNEIDNIDDNEQSNT